MCVCVVFHSDGKGTAVKNDSDFESTAVAAIQIERVNIDRKKGNFHFTDWQLNLFEHVWCFHFIRILCATLTPSPTPHLIFAVSQGDVCCNAIRPRNATCHSVSHFRSASLRSFSRYAKRPKLHIFHIDTLHVSACFCTAFHLPILVSASYTHSVKMNVTTVRLARNLISDAFEIASPFWDLMREHVAFIVSLSLYVLVSFIGGKKRIRNFPRLALTHRSFSYQNALCKWFVEKKKYSEMQIII